MRVLLFTSLGGAEDSWFPHGDAAFAPFLEWGEGMAMSSKELAMQR